MIETPADYRSFAFTAIKTPVSSHKCSGIRSFAFTAINNRKQQNSQLITHNLQLCFTFALQTTTQFNNE